MKNEATAQENMNMMGQKDLPRYVAINSYLCELVIKTATTLLPKNKKAIIFNETHDVRSFYRELWIHDLHNQMIDNKWLFSFQCFPASLALRKKF